MSTLLDADLINVLVDNPDTPFGGVIVDLPDAPIVVELNSTTAPVKSVFGRIGDIIALQADYAAFYAPLGGELPHGGSSGQVLTKNSSTELDASWQDVALDLSISPTWTGLHTFIQSPIVPTPTTDFQAATKKYVDDNAGGAPGGSSTQFQYNSSGAFAGTSILNTNGTVVTAIADKILFSQNADATKKFSLDGSGITHATTRNVIIPDADCVAVIPDTGASNNFLTAISGAGVIGKARPTITNLTDLSTTSKLIGSNASANAVVELTLGTNLSITGSTLNAAGGGTVTHTSGNLTNNVVILGAGTADVKVSPGIVSDGGAKITLGLNTSTLGQLKLFGNTSGDATIQPAAVAGTATVVTLPNASSTLPIFGQQMTFTGPSAARTVTYPDANFTVARTDAANTFTGVQTMTSPNFTTPVLGTPTSGNLANCTFPTLNQNTTGSAASLSISGQTGLLTVTGLASTSRIKTVRDAADTILELGGSYTPTGTWTSLTMVTPVLGTPTSGNLANCTFPTLNQSTTGSAASLKSNATTGLMQVVGPGAATTRVKTIRDADDTILELGGSYTPTGTWTSLTMVTPVLGIPTSGTLTNCTGLPIAGLVASTSTAIGVGTIELGHATDTTIARSGSGAITVEGVQVILSGAALGTPSSGTLTNCTFPTLNQSTTGSALSVKSNATTGVMQIVGPAAASTRAKTVRDADDTILELGGSYTPTGTWTSLTMVTPVLGTPTSGTLTNCGGTASSLTAGHATDAISVQQSGGTGLISFAGMVNTNRIKTVRDAADTILELAGSYTPTGTWTSLTMVTPVLGTPTSGTLTNCTIPDSATYTHDVTAVPNQTGGWTEYFVTSSDATNLTTTLADITGLVSGTLSNSTKYEVEAHIVASSSSAAGIEFAVHGAGTGSAATCQVRAAGMTSSATAGATVCITAVDTATVAFATVGASTLGPFDFVGFVTTTSTGTATISLQHVKVTSGTSTVKVGSVMRIRKAHT